MEDEVVFSLRIENKLKKEIEKLAKKDKRSLNTYINIVLEDHKQLIDSGQVYHTKVIKRINNGY